ncbi:MspA family porin [Tsukamurella soli]
MRGRLAARSGVALVAAAAVAAVTAGQANADTFVPLPDGKKNVAAAGRFSAVLRSTGNHAKILPSLATAQTRTTWVTTNGFLDLEGAGQDVNGTLNLSLVSGCQFPGAIGVSIGISGPGVAANVGPNAGASAGLGGVSGGLGIPLSPGTTSGVTGNAGQYPWTSVLDNVPVTGDGTWSVGLKDYDVNYGNCSGYAQARVVTWVELKGSDRVQGYLYGKPFSLG